MFVVDEKLFSLRFIDEGMNKLNLRPCDGDKPSQLSGISLATVDSNLHQHGKVSLCTCTGLEYIYNVYT